MQTIIEKRSFRKRFRIGELSKEESVKRNLSAVLCYPGLTDKALFFIDGKKVTPEEYKDELDRQNLLFPYEKVAVFTKGDPLPDYVNPFINANPLP